ncbi:hypothetical protein V6N13_029977 [Hibiscus sabdariffa]|uniref:Uncharacterized protein n=2 Tax=Hibiscus sabdariffa TaxID=183260 RepID=A0ABR2T956_9ROSI
MAANTTALLPDVLGPHLDVAATPLNSTVAPVTVPKLAAAITPLATIVAIVNAPHVAATTAPLGTIIAPITFDSNVGHLPATYGLETNIDAPLLFNNMGLSAIPMTILPTQPVGELDNEMGKSFLTMPSMLFVFNEWLSKESSPPTATNDKEVFALISQGAKRNSSMQDDNKLKKPFPPNFFKD